MKPVRLFPDLELYEGDCLAVLPELPANSVDTVITDPPYGLKFMQNTVEWDHSVPGIPFWQAVLRVAKPGAFLLAFGGTRTHHRLMVAIEDAGWQIRDCMMWLYGSGFPKSANVSKQIDRAAGAERESRQIAYTGNALLRSGGQNTRPWMEKALEQGYHELAGDTPVTELAQQWQGWGTSLKPAWEIIIVAMKPLDGTFAQNAERWGVAGLWVDGARLDTGDEIVSTPQGNPAKRQVGENLGISRADQGRFQAAQRASVDRTNELGRWPTNVILDEEAGQLLDEQSGECKSSHGIRPRGNSLVYGSERRNTSFESYGDKGGASRFFYCAKVSPSERGPGNRHPTVKPVALLEYLCTLTRTPTGGVVLDPFMGSGTTALACAETGRPFIGVEKEPAYFRMAKARLWALAPMMNQDQEEA